MKFCVKIGKSASET